LKRANAVRAEALHYRKGGADVLAARQLTRKDCVDVLAARQADRTRRPAGFNRGGMRQHVVAINFFAPILLSA
jgi:hypothetical protein